MRSAGLEGDRDLYRRHWSLYLLDLTRADEMLVLHAWGGGEGRNTNRGNKCEVRPEDGHYRASIIAQHLYCVSRLPIDENDSHVTESTKCQITKLND